MLLICIKSDLIITSRALLPPSPWSNVLVTFPHILMRSNLLPRNVRLHWWHHEHYYLLRPHQLINLDYAYYFHVYLKHQSCMEYIHPPWSIPRCPSIAFFVVYRRWANFLPQVVMYSTESRFPSVVITSHDEMSYDQGRYWSHRGSIYSLNLLIIYHEPDKVLLYWINKANAVNAGLSTSILL